MGELYGLLATELKKIGSVCVGGKLKTLTLNIQLWPKTQPRIHMWLKTHVCLYSFGPKKALEYTVLGKKYLAYPRQPSYYHFIGDRNRSSFNKD